MGATGCEFDVNEVAASTDRILDNAAKLEERRENLNNILAQCKTIEQPGLAFNYILLYCRERIIDPITAAKLATPFVEELNIQFAAMKSSARLMSICTAPYTKA